jgi:2-amino-4-hydroxy-6-hydroxymethyldihydropteridine diphosphokinase
MELDRHDGRTREQTAAGPPPLILTGATIRAARGLWSNVVMARYFLALGSNLGDREANLRMAVRRLGEHGVDVTRSASVYTTEPKEILDQPWFLNTVIEVETSLDPDALMRLCLEIESAAGRERAEPNGPRTLDVDVILAGETVIDSDGITVPHPRYADRRFVVEPLVEIAPDQVDPVLGKTVQEILEDLGDEAAVTRYGPPLV